MDHEETEKLLRRLVTEERLHTHVASKIANEASKPKTWLSDNVKWLVITILVPLVTWLVGYQQQQLEQIRANADKDIAIARQATEAVLADARNDVAAMTALLPALSDPDERKSSLALAVLTRLKDAQHGDPKIQALFVGVLVKIDQLRNSNIPAQANLGARQLEAVQTALGKSQQTNAVPLTNISAATLTQVGAIKPSRVYMQIFMENQRGQALDVQTALRNQGVPVPGVENVGTKLAAGTLPRQQIRYFSDGDLGAARWTQARLEDAGLGRWEVFKTRSNGAVPAGQVEVWWANSPNRSP